MKKLLLAFVGLAVLGGTANVMFASKPSEQTVAKPSALTPEQAAQQKAAEQAASEARNIQLRADADALRVRIAALPTKSPGSVAWQAEAKDIADDLSKFPASGGGIALRRDFDAQVTPTLQKMAQALARDSLAQTAQKWVDAADTALVKAGIEGSVTLRKKSGKYSAVVQSALMGRVMADRMANESGLLDSADRHGFDELVFKNKISGESLTYTLSGGKNAANEVVRQMRAEWGLK
jgi:hypothetical protein